MSTVIKTFPLTSNVVTLLGPNLYYIEGEHSDVSTWVINSNSITDGWAQQHGLGKPFDVNAHIPKSRYKRSVMGYKVNIDITHATADDLKRMTKIKPGDFVKIQNGIGYRATSNSNLYTDQAMMSYYVSV